MDRVATARAYYRALDKHDYDRLVKTLASDFRHDRPDRTIDGRDRFVRFMREERPQTDTSHPIDDVFERTASGESAGDERVAVRGRLLDADGDEITSFVDVFEFDDGVIGSIRTYTH